ncbi:winged helix DNA-binding domain-containing protein [Angustibacter sp. McL0619]|uniref:winged helix DNA-binding domain-containing protein n=1 Tax=Angustibacter sp. McL0619 TaxID=3415676 RepID=UPI003CEDBB2E
MTDPSVLDWTWRQALSRRLHRHLLDEPSATAGPGEVAAAICGVHAQVMSAAEVSIGIRSSDGDAGTVRSALWESRELVKTYGPRGTVHLLAARDLPMWSAALGATPSTSPFAADVRMSPEQTDAVVAAVADALSGDELTLDELSDAVVERAGSWAGELVIPAFQTFWPRWRQAVTVAAWRGALCFGPPRGRQLTFTSPRRWIGETAALDAQTGLDGAVLAYLRSYGPATPAHFARWLASPKPWAAAAFSSLGDRLRQVRLEGAAAWVVAGDEHPDDRAPAGVRLLPYFDAYAVGCHPRERLFPGAMFERATARGQAGNFAVLLVDGEVFGVWHQKVSGRRLDVTVEPRADLSARRQRLLAEQVERIGAIRSATPRLTIGPVTSGAHA